MSEDKFRRLKEDRALRDASLALLKADVANLRADLSGKGIGDRLMGRISEGAVDVFDEAVDVANNNRGVLATLIAAILVWFARNPIISLFTDDEDRDGRAADYDDEDYRQEPDAA